MTFSCFKQNGRHVLRETSELPSCTLCDDVSLCLGRVIGSNSVDFHVAYCIMIPFGLSSHSYITHTVICVSMETRKNVTNHGGQSQNIQSGFDRTCPTCVSLTLYV